MKGCSGNAGLDYHFQFAGKLQGPPGSGVGAGPFREDQKILVGQFYRVTKQHSPKAPIF